jgi:hypothetical protein
MRFLSISVLGFLVSLAVAGTANAGPAPGGTDTDGDGIEDAFDNCLLVSNPDQADTDTESFPSPPFVPDIHGFPADGCGDACQPHVTCDTQPAGAPDFKVGGAEFSALLNQFGNVCPPLPAASCTADCTGDNKVGGPDFAGVLQQFGNEVGPTGITTAQCDPATCPCP